MLQPSRSAACSRSFGSVIKDWRSRNVPNAVTNVFQYSRKKSIFAITDLNAAVRQMRGKIINGSSCVDSEIDLNAVSIIQRNGTIISTTPIINTACNTIGSTVFLFIIPFTILYLIINN